MNAHMTVDRKQWFKVKR